jgi:hypothetical protein
MTAAVASAGTYHLAFILPAFLVPCLVVLLAERKADETPPPVVAENSFRKEKTPPGRAGFLSETTAGIGGGLGAAVSCLVAARSPKVQP